MANQIFVRICLVVLFLLFCPNIHPVKAQDFDQTRILAEQGQADAQNFLGVIYTIGKGVAQDYKIAHMWFTRAAEQGQADAQNSLGLIYHEGLGVAQDYKIAHMWFTRAAEQGQANAQNSLGAMYREGLGVAQDYKIAHMWFTRAAEQGQAYGQLYLGLMYAIGKGVTQDYKIAHMWFNVVSYQGTDEAKTARETRDSLAKQMTLEQIAEAQENASKCIANNFKNCQ